MNYKHATLYALVLATGLFSVAACKSKAGSEKELWPVLPYLYSQAAAVDSTLAPIRKLIYHDDGQVDTQFVHRKDFRKVAADFLELPDISNKKYSGDYNESEVLDETINRLIVRQTPIDPEDALIQSQEVLIKPALEGDKVTTVMIHTLQNEKDSTIQKRMIWQIDKSFQVTTIVQKGKGNETIATYKVEWGVEE